MKRLCTILARGGSKGLPDKNIRPLAGEPLIAHSIRHAKESGIFDAIAVSSDSDRILEIARKCEVDILVKRPDALATDQAGKIPAIRHCLMDAELRTEQCYDLIVDLQPTSPLRIPEDVAGAVKLFEEARPSNVITAFLAKGSPYFNVAEKDARGFAHLSKKPADEILCRQNVPDCFELNGSIYVWPRESILSNAAVFMDRTMIYEMSRERSIDIDEELDFQIAEFLLSNRKRRG